MRGNAPFFVVIAVIAIFIWTMFAPPPYLAQLKINLANVARIPLRTLTLSVNSLTDISKIFYADSEKLELKRKVFLLERRIIELREASLENKRLRSLLNLRRDGSKTYIVALTIGRDPNNWASAIFIDKGTRDGIAKQMAVASSGGLVGCVSEAGKSFSKVMLINDVDSKVAAVLQRTREQGLLVGTPEGRCKLIYLSLGADVAKGDVVMTSGAGGVYPKGMAIGSVVYVGREKGMPYKYAIVKPYVELSKLEEVLCVK